jgi:4'-phosphopantetheinyl transferase
MIEQDSMNWIDSLRDEVHVWYASTENIVPDIKQSKFYLSLSSEEKKRSESFIFNKDKDQYILAHGLLREILSKYSGFSSSELDFGLSEKGKPFILNKMGFVLEFSLTHTRGLVACVISLDNVCGIDAETIRHLEDAESLFSSICSQQEMSKLHQENNQEKRQLQFYKYWVLKEAYVKALGEGLSFGMNRVAFNILEYNINSCFVDGDKIAGWTFDLFEPCHGGILATAFHSNHEKSKNIRYMDFLS